MRYRRISYRYALTIRTGPEPLGSGLLAGRERIGLAQPWWRPAADIAETADAIAVTVELAGVSVDDLDVLLYDDAVVIEGVRRLPPPPLDARYHAAEIRQGRFRLDIPLPCGIDADGARARYDNGLLHLEFPKARGGATP
jgi:HSP20 family protein